MPGGKRGFPYGVRPGPNGGVYAQQANGREVLLTGPAAEMAKAKVKALDTLAPETPSPMPIQTAPMPPPSDFDAHQFQVMADAALQLPRTARGGVRDLAPDDARPDARATAPAALDAAPPAPPTAHTPTLAEVQETRAYVDGPQDPAQAWDTVYVDPAEAEAERKRKAAALGAHVKHATDVAFYEPPAVSPVM